ncbi:MAG: cell wall hydrolase [Rhodospirillaceae bacterium]
MSKVFVLAMVAGVCLFSGKAGAEPVETSAKCLADNIYFEARDDGRAGWSAVGHVTLNRWHRALQVRPDVTLCDIVYAGARRGHRHCQFSWACHHTPKVKREQAQADRILDYAYRLLAGQQQDPTSGATYFHEKRVHPRWARDGTAVRTTAIGRHYFYRPVRQTEVAQFFDAR